MHTIDQTDAQSSTDRQSNAIKESLALIKKRRTNDTGTDRKKERETKPNNYVSQRHNLRNLNKEREKFRTTT